MKYTSTLKTKALLLLAICIGVITTSNAQSVAQILADINVSTATAAGNPSTGSSNFANTYTRVGSKIIFRATDGSTTSTNFHGAEIFVLDLSQPLTGTVGGNAPGSSLNPWTRTTNPAVIDLFPTAFASAKQSGNPQEFVVAGNKVYCSVAITLATAGTRNFGTELLEYDPSQPISDSAGTGRYTTFTNPKIIDLNPGTVSGAPTGLVNYNNNLYFIATNATNGTELWKLDPAQGISSNNGASNFDGTTNPMLINVGVETPAAFSGVTNSSGASTPVGCGGKIYFQGASSINSGWELWVYDPATSLSGTNPKMVADVNTTSITGTATAIKTGSNPQYLTDVNGVLFYRSTGKDTLGVITQPILANPNWELWKYEPSQATSSSGFGLGTNPGMVKDINAAGQTAAAESFTGCGVFSPSGTGLDIPTRFPQINGVVYFWGMNAQTFSTPNTNGYELWRSDGTASGTYIVKDLNPIQNTTANGPKEIYAYNGKLFFNAYYSTSSSTAPSNCVFVYNPSIDTTTSQQLDSTTNPMLLMFNKSTVSTASLATRFAGYNGMVYFSLAESENGTTQIGVYNPSKTYSSSGLGTFLTKFNNTTNPKMLNVASVINNSNPSLFTNYNGTLIFAAQADTKGNELYTMNIYNSITASAGSNGSISNSGVANVNYGYDQTYTITAANGYCADSLIVDGVKVAPATTYTFTNVTASHTIVANFIATVTPSVSISTATTSVCSGSNTSFTASGVNGGSAPVYQWKKNGTDVGSGSSITFLANTLSNNDVITCVLTANNACQTISTATSNAITMTVNASPSVASITNGVSTITTASLCTLGSTYKYYCATPYGTWSSSNPAVASVSGYSQSGIVAANSNGTATITYSVSSAGCSSTSSVLVTVAQQDAPTAITGTNSVCVNATTALSSTAPVGTTGVWSSSNDRGIISVGGVYAGKNAGTWGEARYTVTNAAGCKAFAAYAVTVNPIPSVPTITFAPGTPNPQLGAPTGGFCVGKVFTVVGTPNVPAGVWSSTGFISVTSLGVVTINTVGAGSIKYTYTNAAGCSNSRTMSGTGYNCAARGINNNEQLATNNDFSMYPNPAKGYINLNVETLVGNGSIVVTDLYGKSVKTQTLSMGTNTVNTSNLSRGFYLVSVITSEGKTTKKLIIE